jgi:predicted nucleic acid-binding protein
MAWVVHNCHKLEQFAVSAYDARFLGAAQTFKAKLVTEDARLRLAVPALTISLSDALAV